MKCSLKLRSYNEKTMIESYECETHGGTVYRDMSDNRYEKVESIGHYKRSKKTYK